MYEQDYEDKRRKGLKRRPGPGLDQNDHARSAVVLYQNFTVPTVRFPHGGNMVLEGSAMKAVLVIEIH